MNNLQLVIIEKTAQKYLLEFTNMQNMLQSSPYGWNLQVLKFHDKSPCVKILQMWQCDDRCSSMHIPIMGHKKLYG